MTNLVIIRDFLEFCKSYLVTLQVYKIFLGYSNSNWSYVLIPIGKDMLNEKSKTIYVSD